MSFRGTYLQLLANDLPTHRQAEIWHLIGEEVQDYTSYQYKPSEPKYMHRFSLRATIERARVQLVQWTLFWRFVTEKGGFKAVFPAVEHMSIGDDQGDLTLLVALTFDGNVSVLSSALSTLARSLRRRLLFRQSPMSASAPVPSLVR